MAKAITIPDPVADAIEAKALRSNKKLDSLAELIFEAIRWGLDWRTLISTANGSSARLNKSLRSKGLPGAPSQWLELRASAIDNDIPDAFNAQRIIVDGEADPPTTRSRTWSEHKLFVTRDGRHFVPASDGEEYFDADTIAELGADVLAVHPIADVPKPDGGA